nr:hypothetical protein [Wolbachia endosymbiont of Litomosoides sigmodontis]
MKRKVSNLEQRRVEWEDERKAKVAVAKNSLKAGYMSISVIAEAFLLMK